MFGTINPGLTCSYSANSSYCDTTVWMAPLSIQHRDNGLVVARGPARSTRRGPVLCSSVTCCRSSPHQMHCRASPDCNDCVEGSPVEGADTISDWFGFERTV
jgi:hypothetical protein